MAIQKRFIHFKKFSDFNSKKLSANEANTQYTVGVSGAIQDGEPDILYQSYVWIKDTKQQWTHGQLYDGSSDTYTTEFTVSDLFSISEDSPLTINKEALINAVLSDKIIIIPYQDNKGSYMVSIKAFDEEIYFNIYVFASVVSFVVYPNELTNEITVEDIFMTDFQEVLISGENIRTINGESLIGEGSDLELATKAELNDKTELINLTVSTEEELGALDVPLGTIASVISGGQVIETFSKYEDNPPVVKGINIVGTIPEAPGQDLRINFTYDFFIYYEFNIDTLSTRFGYDYLGTDYTIYDSKNQIEINTEYLNNLNNILKESNYTFSINYDESKATLSELLNSFLQGTFYFPLEVQTYVKTEKGADFPPVYKPVELTTWSKVYTDQDILSDTEIDAILNEIFVSDGYYYYGDAGIGTFDLDEGQIVEEVEPTNTESDETDTQS